MNKAEQHVSTRNKFYVTISVFCVSLVLEKICCGIQHRGGAILSVVYIEQQSSWGVYFVVWGGIRLLTYPSTIESTGFGAWSVVPRWCSRLSLCLQYRTISRVRAPPSAYILVKFEETCSCAQIDSRKARGERKLATFDQNRRAVGMLKPVRNKN